MCPWKRGRTRIGIRFVVPDHPWVDSSDGAAVRVTLTTVGKETDEGLIARVVKEQSQGDDEIAVELAFDKGYITPNLTIGVDPAKATELKANRNIASVGYQLTGNGFILDPKQRQSIGNSNDAIIRPLLTGRDITQKSRNLLAIDLFGLPIDQVRKEFPEIYQWVIERVKPERDQKGSTLFSWTV